MRVRQAGPVAVIALFAFGAAPASAHIERASYWPDPRPDCTITPCAGGAVPKARSLASALRRTPGTTVRVVCRPNSLSLVKRSVARAVRRGYDVRPHDHRRFTRASGRRLLGINRALHAKCRFHEIQPAVTASDNNDRVVVMPGIYTEPTARSKPTFDPACNKYKDSRAALSYEGDVHCPNDQSLVAVIGRGVGSGKDPDPPLEDRHGIPNLGPCVRCNLQLEGSGVSADDVKIDAGDPSKGNGGPSAAGHVKDVVVKVDRADGFVLRNLTVRHALEHGIYILETDGYLFDRFKSYYSADYGVLTFVEDHGLISNCDVAGSGDSGIYPGAGAKTSAGRDPKYYPEARYSQEIRYCDSHHNNSGYSGTDGAAVHVDHNNFYDNSLGFTTDVFTAPGHPGFPQQGDLIEDNNFYSNNFNPYVKGSEVPAKIAAPVGTGLWIAGGNDNVVRNNRFWDNRRRGVMLFSAPDVAICGPAIGTPVTGCDATKISTSYGNRFYGNTMGVTPGGQHEPNGTDFWWDAFPGNTGNCWYDNIAANDKGISTSPSSLPDCNRGADPSTSVGLGNPVNQSELYACLVGFDTAGYPNGNQTICTWTLTPAPVDRRRARATVAPAGIAPLGPMLPWAGVTQAAARLDLPPLPRPLGLYTCADWRAATPAGRQGLLERLRGWVGGPIEGDVLRGYGTVLPDGQAAAMFDARCRPSWARGFLLYKQYGYAAAFAGIAP